MSPHTSQAGILRNHLSCEVSVCTGFCGLVAASVFAGAAHAATISGRVIGPAGQGIPRVSLVTDQRGVGAQADDSGNFTLTVPDEVTRVTFTRWL